MRSAAMTPQSMMIVLVRVVGCVVFACSDGGDPKDQAPVELLADDGPVELRATDVPAKVDLQEQVCAPDCEGRVCGGNGCGGSCGTCGPTESCDDTGQCGLIECISSKDCPGDLVCSEELGRCVVCEGDEDCQDGFVCMGDHDCHEVFPCSSDKDCKEHEMVCDKVRGVCAECLVALDCADEEFCLQNMCVQDVCVASDQRCQGKQTQTCLEDGSGWADGALCADAQYCEAGSCKDQVCVPGEVFCIAAQLMECDSLGSQAVKVQDCGAAGQVCVDGKCVTPVCPPATAYCHDDWTAAACSADGMKESVAPCPGQTYCDQGSCVPWNCPPGKSFCDGSVHKVCDGAGKGALFEEDCAAMGMICAYDICLEQVCVPDLPYCVADFLAALCSSDGLEYESTACLEGTYCKAGQCVAQVCEPDSAYCAGPVAFVCDGIGSSFVSVVNCAEEKLVCVQGACTECIPECSGKDCGPDGCWGVCGECDDGNDCTADACMNAQCQHGLVELGAACQKPGVCVGACAGDQCLETAVEDCLTPGDDNCNGLTNEVGAKNCNTYYSDADGDGFGGTPVCTCKVPEGGSALKQDCCDSDPKAFPGQTLYFADPVAGCGGFDFDCNELAEKEDVSSCIVAPCPAGGWFQPLPDCGKSGNYCPNCLACGTCVGATVKKTQKCR